MRGSAWWPARHQIAQIGSLYAKSATAERPLLGVIILRAYRTPHNTHLKTYIFTNAASAQRMYCKSKSELNFLCTLYIPCSRAHTHTQQGRSLGLRLRSICAHTCCMLGMYAKSELCWPTGCLVGSLVRMHTRTRFHSAQY